MIVVRVRQQDGVDVTEPRIRLIDHEPRIVENPDAGGIFKQDRAIAGAQLSGVTAERRHADERLSARQPGRHDHENEGDGYRSPPVRKWRKDRVFRHLRFSFETALSMKRKRRVKTGMTAGLELECRLPDEFRAVAAG